MAILRTEYLLLLDSWFARTSSKSMAVKPSGAHPNRALIGWSVAFVPTNTCCLTTYGNLTDVSTPSHQCQVNYYSLLLCNTNDIYDQSIYCLMY